MPKFQVQDIKLIFIFSYVFVALLRTSLFYSYLRNDYTNNGYVYVIYGYNYVVLEILLTTLNDLCP